MIQDIDTVYAPFLILLTSFKLGFLRSAPFKHRFVRKNVSKSVSKAEKRVSFSDPFSSFCVKIITTH